MYFAYFAIIELPVVTQGQSALNGKNSKTIFNTYIDIARAKSEALINNTFTRKKMKLCNAKWRRQ